MKFFHLSDLHIGLKLLNHDLREDQEYIFHQIADYAGEHRPDAIVIAGDIYDKAIPSAEAVELFDAFVSELSAKAPEAELMMISGNHDSAQRINVFRTILQKRNIHMIGLPPGGEQERIEKVTLTDSFGPVNFYLLPFVKPSMVKQIVGTQENGNALSYNETLHRLIEREELCPQERNVLVSHQFYLPMGSSAEQVERMDSEIRTVGNVDEVKADILERFDYAALGHIHKPMKVGSDAYRYCGTPLACSVSEAGQQKGILEVELGAKGELHTQVLPLHPLREVRMLHGTLQEILGQGSEDYVSILLTDRVDLDVIDMQDRIRSVFPNVLEIRREICRTSDYRVEYTPETEKDVFTLCTEFLQDLDEEEQKLLRDVINSIQEV
ncbi:MAG: exonuclease SbcCD subunit D [Eubacteriales bacterium]|nr:exonuclease SbcCD subunit D [Eubacteriales bacterium]